MVKHSDYCEVGTSTARANIDGSTPSFQVEGGNTSDAYISCIRNGNASQLFLGRSNGSTVGSNTAIPGAGYELGFVNFVGNNGTNFKTAASIVAYSSQAYTGSVNGGYLTFSTTADGASSPTERMRIDNTGGTTIYGATTSSLALIPANTYSATLKLQATGTADWNLNAVGATGKLELRTNNNTTTRFTFTDSTELWIGYTTDNGGYPLQVNGQIFATSATIATSDARYKENVQSLGGCIDLVKNLRPVSFTWKPQQDITRTDDEGNEVLVREGHNFPDGTQVGFIAQEVQEVLADKPWLTSVIKENVRPAVTDADGNELAPEEEFLGIAEGNLIAVLTSALQEAIGEIQALKARVVALEES